MTQLTMELPDNLAARVRGMDRWLPTILEVSLLGLRTEATAVASELIQFLSSGPSAEEVLDFHISDEAQERTQRLLALNESGLLHTKENTELDELLEIERVVIALKTQIAGELQKAE